MAIFTTLHISTILNKGSLLLTFWRTPLTFNDAIEKHCLYTCTHSRAWHTRQVKASYTFKSISHALSSLHTSTFLFCLYLLSSIPNSQFLLYASSSTCLELKTTNYSISDKSTRHKTDLGSLTTQPSKRHQKKRPWHGSL